MVKQGLALALAGAFSLLGSASFAQGLSFSKVHTPDTIGSGGTSQLVLTITNGTGTLGEGIGFTDVLPVSPGAVTIADNGISTTCSGGTVTGAKGAGSFTLSGAQLPVSESCTVTVNVTAATMGVHSNVTGSLVSTSHGTDGTASGDLTVSATLPGFTKALSPSTLNLGEVTTLTYTIDNSLNASRIGNLDFTETLPTGLTIASPNNASTDCVAASFPDTTLTAVPGSGTVTLDADGSAILAGFEVLPGNAACSVVVDVVAGSAGTFDLNSGDLLADFVSAGSSSASLTVNAVADAPNILKDFTDDPVSPGTTATVEYTMEFG